MNIKEKIHFTLNEAYPSLKNVKDDYFIIGSSALILSGIEIKNTHDIDILLTDRDVFYLQTEWENRMIKDYITQEDDLFRSTFSRYRFEKMDVETIGNLEVNKNGIWKPLKIEDYTIITLDTIQIKIPTLEEQMRIFNLFGREKDLEKIKLMSTAKIKPNYID